MPPSLHKPSWSPSDAELVLAAQGGDAASLGVLLERHRPRLFAAALRLVGYRPDAEDAVQETCLLAMRYVGAVRDPSSAGAWLHAILRRACLQHRRRLGGEILTDALPDIIDEGPGPEQHIEQLELREWIWEALERLPDALRVTAMLRYFGSYDSYEEVAGILDVPIGTVRSRLAEVKRKLADALLASAGLLDRDALARKDERERFWTDAIESVVRRGDSDEFVSHFSPDVLVGWPGKEARGRHLLAAEIETDLRDGVYLAPERVLTSGGATVLESRFVNPPESPDHCPPGLALVLLGPHERTSQIRLYLAPKLPRPDP
ncbi:MAG TPA: RNA polymerase sigma factor [Gemmatimonadaceae bacterium]